MVAKPEKKKVDLAAVTASPIFCATFADGQKVRMSTWHAPEATSLDLGRGVRLARIAYRSRMKREPVPIAEARFEDADGKTLATYSADELRKVS